jgi:transcriptional regulator with XRE-family HTH domain
MMTGLVTPISIRLEGLRTAKGWSQAELARQSGVPQPTISRIEAGTRRVDLDVLEKLASALGVNASMLIEHSDSDARQKRGKGR